jgi:hypothetical protein
VERKLYPNVDFYTGLIYEAMGFPVNMFTVLFALGRLPGWIAQWREMISDPETEDRPARAQIYTGEIPDSWMAVAIAIVAARAGRPRFIAIAVMIAALRVCAGEKAKL